MSGTKIEKSLTIDRKDRVVKKRLVNTVTSAFKRAGTYLKEWMKEPNALPTYCFEYAPEC